MCNVDNFRTEPCPFCDSGKHQRTNFLIVMKRKHKICLSRTRKCTVRTGLSLHNPANAKESG